MDILEIKQMEYRKQTLIRDNFILQLTCDKWFVITTALQCQVYKILNELRFTVYKNWFSVKNNCKYKSSQSLEKKF